MLFNHLGFKSEYMTCMRRGIRIYKNLLYMCGRRLHLCIKHSPDHAFFARQNRFFWPLGSSAATTCLNVRYNQGLITRIDKTVDHCCRIASFQDFKIPVCGVFPSERCKICRVLQNIRDHVIPIRKFSLGGWFCFAPVRMSVAGIKKNGKKDQPGILSDYLIHM